MTTKYNTLPSHFFFFMYTYKLKPQSCVNPILFSSAHPPKQEPNECGQRPTTTEVSWFHHFKFSTTDSVDLQWCLIMLLDFLCQWTLPLSKPTNLDILLALPTSFTFPMVSQWSRPLFHWERRCNHKRNSLTTIRSTTLLASLLYTPSHYH